jgi:hypothetical protein
VFCAFGFLLLLERGDLGVSCSLQQKHSGGFVREVWGLGFDRGDRSSTFGHQIAAC